MDDEKKEVVVCSKIYADVCRIESYLNNVANDIDDDETLPGTLACTAVDAANAVHRLVKSLCDIRENTFTINDVAIDKRLVSVVTDINGVELYRGTGAPTFGDDETVCTNNY